MHVGRLDRHQRAQSPGGLDDDLRDQPGIHLSIVGIHEDAFTPGVLAPSRDLLHLPEVHPGLRQRAGRTGGENLQGVIEGVGGHI